MFDVGRFSAVAVALLIPAALWFSGPVLVPTDSSAGFAPAAASVSAAPAADIANGMATFQTMCGVCHAVKTTGGPVEGPNLVGLVGRQAGSHPNYTRYSPALKASGLMWTEENLNQFLKSPMAMVPGTFMPMLIPDDKTRADVIGYLSTLKPE
jgi:cytochrome c